MLPILELCDKSSRNLLKPRGNEYESCLKNELLAAMVAYTMRKYLTLNSALPNSPLSQLSRLSSLLSKRASWLLQPVVGQ
jgi:hypothetical protein